MGKKEKKTRKKGKKVRKGRKHEGVKIWEKYEVKGDSVERKNIHCPRCGPGTMLSIRKGSSYCGKCGYTDIKGKAADKPPEQRPEIKHEEPKEEKPKEAEEKEE